MDNLRSWLLAILVVIQSVMFLSQWIVSSAYYQPQRVESAGGKALKRQNSLRRYVRNRFLFIGLLYVLWLGACLLYPQWTDKNFDLNLFNFWPFMILGFLIALCGQALGIYSQFVLGRNFRMGINSGERTELVSVGPYSYMRNPVFVGLLVAQFALVLLLPDTISISLMVISFLMLEIQIRQEEDHLEDLHGGSFEVYRRTVPRYLPMRLIKRLFGFKETSVINAPTSETPAVLRPETPKLTISPAVTPTYEENKIMQPSAEAEKNTAESEPAHMEMQTVEALSSAGVEALQTCAENEKNASDENVEPPEDTDEIEIETMETGNATDNAGDSRMDAVLKKMMQKNRS